MRTRPGEPSFREGSSPTEIVGPFLAAQDCDPTRIRAATKSMSLRAMSFLLWMDFSIAVLIYGFPAACVGPVFSLREDRQGLPEIAGATPETPGSTGPALRHRHGDGPRPS